jgi:hypothetical protein
MSTEGIFAVYEGDLYWYPSKADVCKDFGFLGEMAAAWEATLNSGEEFEDVRFYLEADLPEEDTRA